MRRHRLVAPMAEVRPVPEGWGRFPSPPAPVEPALDIALLDQCIHCGFCIQACPTYRDLGVETASPRGRLAMMKAVAQGQLAPDDGFAAEMDLCLGCRACESACPSGVQYGLALEQARALAARTAPPPLFKRLTLRLAFRRLLPHAGRLRLLVALLGSAQRTGLLRLVARLLPGRWREQVLALPPAPGAATRRELAAALVEGPATGGPRVGLFRGCIQDALFAGTNAATVRLLQATGCGVTAPPQAGGGAQTCCGALAAHGGDREYARALARRNIAAFAGYDLVVNNAGGCGAILKEYGHLLRDDPVWAPRAADFAARVRDISEVLAERGLPVLGPLAQRVTYQDSCHLHHSQRVRQQPRRLLQAVPGLRYVELKDADRCCGSAGIYNLTHPEMAGRVLAEKMDNAAATEAEVIVTSNPGCLLQLRLGLQRAGLADAVQVMHLADLLDAARSADKA